MTLIEAIRSAFAAQKPGDRACFGCVDFCDDPALIEAALPGLSAMSSGHASVRAQDGLCLRYSHILNGRQRCPAYRVKDPVL